MHGINTGLFEATDQFKNIVQTLIFTRVTTSINFQFNSEKLDFLLHFDLQMIIRSLKMLQQK